VNKSVAVFGARGFGLEVAALIERINEARPQWDLIGFFDDEVPEGRIVNDYPVLGGMDRLNRWPTDPYLTLALGNPKTNRNLLQRMTNGKIFFPALFHPSAIAAYNLALHYAKYRPSKKPGEGGKADQVSA